MSKTKKERAAAERKRQTSRRARAKRDRVALAAAPWDHGAAGPANRIGLVVEERGELNPRTGKMVNPNGVTGVRRVDMLDLYLRRGVISPRAHAAGQILRALWLRTEMGQCSPWLRDRVDSSPKPDAAVAVQLDRLSALIRVSRLVRPADERVIDAVCAHGAGVGSLPEYRGAKHHLGLEHLSAALEGLADRMERA